MSRVRTIPHAVWTAAVVPGSAEAAISGLERGHVLFLPGLAFEVERQEEDIFSPAILSSSKNTSFDPRSGRVGGTTLTGAPLERLRAVLTRFSDASAALVGHVLPRYGGRIERARASFRPAEIAGRPSTWRKDDTRLHVDSFPASPVQGRRILRVFSNVNPSGRARSWRVGEDFDRVAGRFAHTLRLPAPGTALVLQALGLTKTRRTPYDALMLQLHDRMKGDAAFQRDCDQESVDFPAGSTWMAFTDQVSHAAMAGQHQLEQTFLLPVDAMIDEGLSPLRVLERLTARPLI